MNYTEEFNEKPFNKDFWTEYSKLHNDASSNLPAYKAVKYSKRMLKLIELFKDLENLYNRFSESEYPFLHYAAKSYHHEVEKLVTKFSKIDRVLNEVSPEQMKFFREWFREAVVEVSEILDDKARAASCVPYAIQDSIFYNMPK